MPSSEAFKDDKTPIHVVAPAAADRNWKMPEVDHMQFPFFGKSGIEPELTAALIDENPQQLFLFMSIMKPCSLWYLKQTSCDGAYIAEYQLKSQLSNVTSQSSDELLDTRTPPKIKQQLKKPAKDDLKVENSHAGVAIPVDESELTLEENTRSTHFYKIESKSTTDGGLSTWVLLNSQTVAPSSSTTKLSKKTTTQKLPDVKNVTAVDTELFNKITKPLFKKRPEGSTTKVTTTTLRTTPLTKIKASTFTSALSDKNKTGTTNTEKVNTQFHEVSTISPKKLSTTNPTTELEHSLEPKDGEIDLPTTTKKPKRPGNKKNKNRKRRPGLEKNSNSTKLATKIQKEKPISSQIYNYLSREIMPTVGVGLVGLMVTAGLAGYFLYPFGAARRSYEVDRKDKQGSYTYSDDYIPGGIAEEEAIGKVIAGMSAYNYRSPTSKDAYSNMYFKPAYYNSRNPQPEASVEAVYLTPSRQYENEAVDSFTSYQNQFQETKRQSNNNNQEVTVAAVPEHGPRYLPQELYNATTEKFEEIVVGNSTAKYPRFLVLRKRRRSDDDNDIENEVVPSGDSVNRTVPSLRRNETSILVTSTKVSLLDAVKEFLEQQIRVGLEFLHNTSRAISRYLSEVQKRLDKNKSNAMESKEQPRK